jgi:hypothetical protein
VVKCSQIALNRIFVRRFRNFFAYLLVASQHRQPVAGATRVTHPAKLPVSPVSPTSPGSPVGMQVAIKRKRVRDCLCNTLFCIYYRSNWPEPLGLRPRATSCPCHPPPAVTSVTRAYVRGGEGARWAVARRRRLILCPPAAPKDRGLFLYPVCLRGRNAGCN